MTELGMALTNSYKDETQRIPGFVGHPFPGVQAKILDADTNEIHEDFDREGELLLKSTSMFSRYYNNEEATAKSFKDGWFLTGDQAVRSSKHNGSYKILGRLSMDIIKKQAYKISALELEHSLTDHPDVNEVGVVGVPHEEFGEEIVAYVVLHKNSKLTASNASAELDRHMRNLHSSYKVPRVYKFLEKLPRNQMGKIDKKTLKKL